MILVVILTSSACCRSASYSALFGKRLCLSNLLFIVISVSTEVFETCGSLFTNFKPVTGHWKLIPNGRYVIDPDGPFGVDPFEVICDFPYKTVMFVTSKILTLFIYSKFYRLTALKFCIVGIINQRQIALATGKMFYKKTQVLNSFHCNK